MLGLILQAAPAAGQQNMGTMNLVMILLIFVVFYFFMIRPQMKRQKEIKKFREALKAGDKIITAGGIYGKIREINDQKVVVEIAENVKVTLDKGSVFATAADTQQK
jgi:preprotein translocase subunit YajC